MKLLSDLFQTAGTWDARKIGLLGTALTAPIGGGCLCAMLIYHTAINHQPPDYAQFGVGLGALAGGGGLGSWAHGKHSGGEA